MVNPRDPEQVLGGAPDPWSGSEMPSPRDGPPYHMTEMIEAEPALADRLLDRLADPEGPAAKLASLLATACDAGRPILLSGCGTSEHAALGSVEILREALRTSGRQAVAGARSPVSIQAFEAALEPELGGPGSVVIGISHEGGTTATNRALANAHESGALVAMVTVSDRSPGARIADIVVATQEMDESWCHTVGYLSPIVAACAVAGHLTGLPVDRSAVRALLAGGLEPDAISRTEALAGTLARVDRLVVVGSGADRAAARELVLKVEEGVHLPAAMRDLETFLHGHLAGTDADTGLIVVLADVSPGSDARAARAVDVLRAAAEIGIPSGAILAARLERLVDATLTPAGRLVVPEAPRLPAAAAALVGSAVPLQLLTERLARARGVNPDPIRRDEAAYLRAADVAG